MATENLSVAETAKLVRQALKEAFPMVRFTVRSSTYSMGASINVKWTDGPTEAEVESVANVFRGADFDSMNDLAVSRRHQLDGKPVRFGADHVTCSRSFSDEAVAAAIADVLQEHGADFEASHQPPPTVEQFRRGACWSMVLDFQKQSGGDVQQLIHRALHIKRFGGLPQPSTTAGRVTLQR